jgi:hypothetical protein
MEASGQLRASAALTPGTHWIGGRVDSRAVLDAVAKRKNTLPAPAGNRTPVVQPVSLVTILTELPLLKLRLVTEDFAAAQTKATFHSKYRIYAFNVLQLCEFFLKTSAVKSSRIATNK